jgi:hypothetical protein
MVKLFAAVGLALACLACLRPAVAQEASVTAQAEPTIKNQFVVVNQSEVPARPAGAIFELQNGKVPQLVVAIRAGAEQLSSTQPDSKNWSLVDLRYIRGGAKTSDGWIADCREFWIQFESRPPRSKFDDDAVKLDPKHNEVLLENDRVRVVRVHFAPGESGPIVDKRPRVIVVLSDSHATVTLPDGHTEVRDAKAGTVSFGNAGRQGTNNVGDTPLENIVVELKSK